MDYKRAHGWWLRVQRPDAKLSKLFSDSRYGGKTHALKAAQALRDQLEKKMSSALGQGRIEHTRDRRSTTSIVGVSLYRNWKRKGRKRYLETGFSGYAGNQGAGFKRSFSIKKYGYQEAYRLACRARRQLVRRRLILWQDGKLK
jgi:hypothetical protein